MNILFVGTGDVAAGYLADRLYRDGHSVVWVTSDKKGVLWNKSFKGKIYRDGYDMGLMRRILDLHGIHVVVFINASYEGTELAERQAAGQIDALRNILRVVAPRKLKQFIYLSSKELDYEQVYTPWLSELAYGENLCRSYEKRSGLPLLILRLGMVYGDSRFDRMGYVGSVFENTLDGHTVECRYANDSCVDLIYGEDAAVAVHDLIKLERLGAYDVITGHPITMDALHDMLGEIMGKAPQVIYLDEEHTPDAGQFWEWSRKLKSDTGWMPYYLLEEKGRDVLTSAFEGFDRRRKKKNTEQKQKRRLRDFFRRFSVLKGILEALLFFVLMELILPLTRGSTDLRYVDVRLLYIALMSVMFGMRIGLVATVLASISYASSLRAEGIDLTFLIYSVETWIPFIIYGITGAALGYMTDRKSDAVDEVEEKYENLQKRYTFLQGIHKEALEVKGRLQQQISSSKESFGKVYEVAEQLNTLSPERVFFQAVNVVTDTIGGCQAAIWLVNLKKGHFARRRACSRSMGETLPNSLDLDKLPKLLEGFEKERIFVNRELNAAYPDFAAPVYREQDIIAFVAVYGMDAGKYTLYYQNLFKVLVGLIENSLVRALEYEDKRRHEIYLPGTELMNAGELSARLALMSSETENTYQTCLQILVHAPETLSLADVSDQLRSLVRENDFAGVDEAGHIRVVLVNALKSDLPAIKRRFLGRGLEVELWESN